MPGRLFIVATPIGNLEDITLRALRVLSEADVIFAEDTRRTAQLLAHHRIRKPLISCHAFSEARRSGEIVRRVREGERVALVSDAGTPGISDPGFRVVRACVRENLPVEPVPGPCAAIAALSAAGLPGDEFHFAGFLPAKAAAARRRLQELSRVPGVLVLYESPWRLMRTLGELATLFPGHEVVVGREISKKFEEFCRGGAADLLARFNERAPKGEFVILVHNCPTEDHEVSYAE